MSEQDELNPDWLPYTVSGGGGGGGGFGFQVTGMIDLGQTLTPLIIPSRISEPQKSPERKTSLVVP